MEFAIGAAIAIVISLISRLGKSHKPKQTHAETEAERKRREADELITVVLPTINNDDVNKNL